MILSGSAPKFRAEVNKMLRSALPSCFSRFLRISHNDHWRSDQQNPDVFLSHGTSRACQSARENRNMEDLIERIGFASNAENLEGSSPNFFSNNGLIASKSYTELTYRYCIFIVVI